MTLVIDPDAGIEETGEIEQRLQDFTSAASPTKGQFEMVRFGLRDEQTGALRGGLKAIIYGHWMLVEAIFIDQDLRGQGWGRKLIEQAEARAREENLVGIWLDTFDFHAPGFYEAAGFSRFGQLDDYPRGHTRAFYKKLL